MAVRALDGRNARSVVAHPYHRAVAVTKAELYATSDRRIGPAAS